MLQQTHLFPTQHDSQVLVLHSSVFITTQIPKTGRLADSNPNVAVVDTVRQLSCDPEVGIVDSIAVEQDLAADVTTEIVAWIAAGSEEEEEYYNESKEPHR